MDFIVGNPPFLGDKFMRRELADDYVDTLRTLYADRLPAQSDLCCYWLEKARAHIEKHQCQRAGLLATQGIRGGRNREVLKRIKQSGDIFWALSDHDWILDGASVHVSMVAFDGGEDRQRILDNRTVKNINPDLTSAATISDAAILQENAELSFIGPSPHGPFDIDGATAERMLSATGNPNGRPNSDVVHPVVSGVDIVQVSRGKWTIDFGVMSEEQAAEYELPFEHVKKHVYPLRKENRRPNYAKKWWQYGEARPGMRRALNARERFVGTARVAKHRVFVWLQGDVLPNDQVVVFARDDEYFFGVLHSRMHRTWSVAQGTQLRERESGFRYTPSTSFETYPMPWPPGAEPTMDPRYLAISEAAQQLVEKRDGWLIGSDPGDKKPRTLTRLYNEQPTWLQMTHHKLDAAVSEAYGWDANISDEAILQKLLELNMLRSAPLVSVSA